MRNKSFKLTIDDPCHENWDAMSPTEQGRFCGSCQKEVIDFSMLSDVEVYSLIKAKGKKVELCGNFDELQLDRKLNLGYKENNLFSLRALVLGASLSSFLALESCKSHRNVGGKFAFHESSILHGNGKIKPLSTYSNDDEKETVISGKVVSEKNMPIAGARVYVYSTKDFSDVAETITDEFGNYSAKFKSGMGPLQISFSSKKYHGEIRSILSDESRTIDVELEHLSVFESNRIKKRQLVRGKLKGKKF